MLAGNVFHLVPEVSNVPGFAVIATALRQFWCRRGSWLPADALHQLGRADLIVVGEPSSAEVEEIRQAAPGACLSACGQPSGSKRRAQPFPSGPPSNT